MSARLKSWLHPQFQLPTHKHLGSLPFLQEFGLRFQPRAGPMLDTVGIRGVKSRCEICEFICPSAIREPPPPKYSKKKPQDFLFITFVNLHKLFHRFFPQNMENATHLTEPMRETKIPLRQGLAYSQPDGASFSKLRVDYVESTRLQSVPSGDPHPEEVCILKGRPSIP